MKANAATNGISIDTQVFPSPRQPRLRHLNKTLLRELLRKVFEENRDRIILCPPRNARISAPRNGRAGQLSRT